MPHPANSRTNTGPTGRPDQKRTPVTTTENPDTTAARTAAAELFAALVTEANEWADDQERALLERFDQTPPHHVLATIAEHHLAPTHLQDAIIGALAVLDPTFAD